MTSDRIQNPVPTFDFKNASEVDLTAVNSGGKRPSTRPNGTSGPPQNSQRRAVVLSAKTKSFQRSHRIDPSHIPFAHEKGKRIPSFTMLSTITIGIASYFGLTVSLFGLSRKFPRAGFFARCLASYACLIACATYGVFASIGLRLVGRGNIAQWTVARSFKWTMRYATGARFRVIEGQEHLLTRPAVFITNHQTELDVLLLGEVFPKYCSQTAKKSLRNVPFLGWFMWASGTVFIDRGNRQTAVKAFDGAAKQMREERQSVFIFPEGTRSYSAEPGLLPFKKGAFHLAVQAQVDIVPVVAENYAHRLSVKKLRFEPGEIRVKGMFLRLYSGVEEAVLTMRPL